MIVANRECTQEPIAEILEMHTHDNYEIFVFYAGNALYHVEGTVYPLEPGDILIMKKAEAHSLWIAKVAPYDRAVISFNADDIPGERQPLLLQFLDARPLGQFNRYPAALFRNSRWLDYIENIYTHRRDRGYMQIYLAVLLNELYEAHPTVQKSWQQSNNPISNIITYINEHFTQPISIETLCREFFISSTQLNRLFKSLTGVPVWKYVVTKRLLYAKELLEKGESPAAACTKCGFHDYSPFYRAYKARFGVSPKTHTK